MRRYIETIRQMNWRYRCKRSIKYFAVEAYVVLNCCSVSGRRHYFIVIIFLDLSAIKFEKCDVQQKDL